MLRTISNNFTTHTRYLFNGIEADDERQGEGNSLNYKDRMHDPRLGRFFCIDPLTAKYPELTPYQFSCNSPIFMIELEGLEGAVVITREYLDENGSVFTISNFIVTDGGYGYGKEGILNLYYDVNGNEKKRFQELDFVVYPKDNKYDGKREDRNTFTELKLLGFEKRWEYIEKKYLEVSDQQLIVDKLKSRLESEVIRTGKKADSFQDGGVGARIAETILLVNDKRVYNKELRKLNKMQKKLNKIEKVAKKISNEDDRLNNKSAEFDSNENNKKKDN